MTNMQLNYSKYLEDKRSNLANEDIKRTDVTEKIRHDVESEKLSWADQDLTRYINDSKLLNDRQIAQLKADTDVLLQDMRNEMTQKQYEQRDRELAKLFDKYDAEVASIEANTALTDEKRKSEKQRRQSDLKEKLLAGVGDAVTAAGDWISEPSNLKSLNHYMSRPGYKNVVDLVRLMTPGSGAKPYSTKTTTTSVNTD